MPARSSERERYTEPEECRAHNNGYESVRIESNQADRGVADRLDTQYDVSIESAKR